MGTLKLGNTTGVTEIFTRLNNQLHGEMSQNFGEHLITVKNSLANGTIRGMKVGRHKLFLEIDLYCKEDVEIPLNSINSNPLHFLYSYKNKVTLKLEDTKKEQSLEEFQTAIIYSRNNNTILQIKKEEHVKIIIISVCIPQKAINVSPIVGNILSLFDKKIKEGSFTYFGSYNLKIADQVNRLDAIDEEGVVRNLFIEGIVQLILGIEIQHYQNDINSQDEVFGSLTKKELKIIQELGQKIRNNVDTAYNINALTLQTGIPAAKLQEGFKYLFGRTVTDYIKNARLEFALGLIKTRDLTISEVVYSVGFSSRSYFSKIFKEKYNCCPKLYQDSIKSLAASA
ncbi:helix-turn-helix domain-containing protein [Aquimarina muelleri]|uniref:helix-turn-helix domain-containing protein n=1 Tax=Aquimarina muelleri TaxID=279356 RepID=UPI003F68849C